MSYISENLKHIEEKIANAALISGRKRDDIKLIAVTKTHGSDIINEAISCGVTDIGENRPQEIIEKYDDVLPVTWHMIGHLQTNKVKYVVGKTSLIHSVDSLKLMDEIERHAKKRGIVQNVLIEVNISGEQSKLGIRPDEIDALLEHAGRLQNVMVQGLMTVAPKTDNSMTNRLHFNNIHRIFIDIQNKTYDNVNMKYLSMGMSGDYETAIEAGANMVRVGSAIFGTRKYQ